MYNKRNNYVGVGIQLEMLMISSYVNDMWHTGMFC